MNKKGDVATGILLVTTITLIIVSLWGMVTFNSALYTDSKNLSEMMNEVIFNEEYLQEQTRLIFDEAYNECGSCNNEELKQRIIRISNEKEKTYRYEGAGNIYAKLRNGEFEIIENEGIKEIIIKDLFVEAERGNNKIKRNFEIIIKLGKGL